MRPAARLSAAIDILESFETTSHSLKALLSNWGRANRFAGSKDRTAISNLVYDALRRRRSLAAGMGAENTRALALAAFQDSLELTPCEMDELCNGEKHAPTPLGREEKAGLQRLFDGQPEAVSLDVAGDIPAWLKPSFERIFGEPALREAQALARRAPIDLRVNSLRASREDVLSILARFNAAPLEEVVGALRIPAPKGAEKGPRLEALEAYEKGWFELQDKGSQMVSVLAGAKAGMKVLDLCAGAGGKTLALAAEMANQGAIYAYDTDPARLKLMPARLKRAGVKVVREMSANDRDHLISLSNKMDLVFIDAPCTGAGTWRRAPDSKWRVTAEHLAARLEDQRSVLADGAPLVRPGGRLVYVTCSVLPEENGDQVEAFLATHTDFAAMPMAELWREAFGTPPPVSPLSNDPGLQLSPARTDSDGFYIVLLEKAG